MAKTRVTVDEKGLELIERSRELGKLRAKRQQKADELLSMDKQIVDLQKVVNGLVGVPAEKS